MKYYKAKAYKVDQGTAKYIADVVVKEEFALPVIGKPTIKDVASNFQYALLDEDRTGKISGERPDNIAQAGYDIGIYRSDISESNIATPEQIVQYNEVYPISPISEEQDALKFKLTTTLGKEESKTR